jgi:hypothetical protein
MDAIKQEPQQCIQTYYDKLGKIFVIGKILNVNFKFKKKKKKIFGSFQAKNLV